MLEARREIGDFENIAEGIRHARDENRRVLEIGLLAADHADHVDGEDAFLLRIGLALGAVEQSGKDRIAIEARKAAPDDLSAAIHQGRDRAIADNGKI